MTTSTNVRRAIPEIVVPGKRLGRHVHHDPRSLRYLTPEAAATSVTWERHTPILDQGNLGSCTGNAEVGALGTGPLWDALAEKLAGGLALDENLAVSIYSDAEKLDGGAGLPTEDQGSSGLSVAKVGKTRGYISGYQHATTVAQAHGALQAGPVMFGTDWFTGMDSPTSEGIVTATGTVRGAHEYLCRQYDAARDLWWLDNSWGLSFGVSGRFAYDTPTLTTLLSRAGDCTSLVPLSQPAPTPTPPPIPATTVGYQFAAADAATLDGWAAKRHCGLNKTAAEAWKRGKAQ